MTETWLPIPGFPGYAVSDQGRIRSYLARQKGRGGRDTWYIASKHQRYLQPSSNGGYLGVNLRASGKTHRFRVASLVLLAFVGPRPKGHVACHGDSSPTNNCLANLRYDTPKGNMADMGDRARYTNRAHKLTDNQVIEIRHCYAADKTLTYQTLASEYKVSANVISCACRGKTYPNIGGPITKRKLSDEDVRAVLTQLEYKTAQSLAKEYGVHESTISQWKNGKRRQRT